VLGSAVAAVNSRGKDRLLAWPLPGLRAFLHLFGSLAEGFRQWNGGKDQRASSPHGDSGRSRSALAIAWWTDAVGRRHVRVLARRAALKTPDLVCLLWPPRFTRTGFAQTWPPLVLVYPAFTFLRVRGGQRQVVATCRCGVVGTPADIGWMGDCCGPCHDRREAGDSVPALVESFVLRTDELPLAGAFSPDGTTLAVSGSETVHLWDVATGRECVSLRHGEDIYSIAFAGDGSALAVGGQEQVSIWRGIPSSPRPPDFTPSATHAPVVFSPDGSLLATGRRVPLGAQLIDLASAPAAKGRLSKQTLWKAYVPELAFSPDGKRLAALLYGEHKGKESWNWRLWDVPGGRTLPAEFEVLPHGGDVCGLAFSPDGRTLAVGIGQLASEVQLWDVEEGTRKATLGPDAGPFAFLPDGRGLLSEGEGGTVKRWNLATGREEVSLEWHTGGLTCFVLSPDGKWLATGGRGVIRLWPVEVL
jgi:WD40 repeat protein